MSLQPYYVSRLRHKTKNSIKPPTVYRKPLNVPFLPCLLKKSFSSLLTENLVHSHGFYQKFIFKLHMVN